MPTQATLYDFTPRAVPVEAWGWDHDHPHRWLYRSNAEAVVKDLGKMPSGAGIWPRLMRNCQPSWHWGCDFIADQYRQDGGIRKAIWADGRVVDCMRVRQDDNYGRDTRIEQAWIEDDTLHIVGDDGIERYLDILDDSECDRADRTGFHPDTIVQHYGILALSKGVTGDAISAIVDLHSCRFETVWPRDPKVDLLWSTIPTTGVVPKLSYAVHHLTEYTDIHPVQYTCTTCTKRRPRGGCQQGRDHDGAWCEGYTWDRTPIKRLRRTVAEEDEDDDMEACCA